MIKSFLEIFIKDPLSHFLLFGLGLFVLNAVVNPGMDEGRVIHIDRPALLAYVQRDAKNFDPEWAEEILKSLNEEDVKFLIERYVWDEVLYRSALAEGMERQDDGVRERLVQKMEFITMSGASVPETITEEAVAEYFEAHKAVYRIDPQVTFTHVFYSYAEHGVEGAAKKAKLVLGDLKARGASFEEAKDYGDISEFHQSYVGSTRDIIEGHFGEETAATIFSAETVLNQWVGPYDSLQGEHLILISARDAGRDALIEEVPWVRGEALAALRRKLEEEQVQELIDQYRVRVEYSQ